MTREQQAVTRKLEMVQDEWLRAYGWTREVGGRWVHAKQTQPCSTFDALALTRAQPLIFGAAVR